MLSLLFFLVRLILSLTILELVGKAPSFTYGFFPSGFTISDPFLLSFFF